MVLSTGKCVSVQEISEKELLKEEKVFQSRYKVAINNSIKAARDKNYLNYLDTEISVFNQWQELKLEYNRRKHK